MVPTLGLTGRRGQGSQGASSPELVQIVYWMRRPHLRTVDLGDVVDVVEQTEETLT